MTTIHLLALVNGYDGNKEQTRACADFIVELMEKYAKGKNCRVVEFQ